MYDDRPKPERIQESIQQSRMEKPSYSESAFQSFLGTWQAPTNFTGDEGNKIFGDQQNDPAQDALDTMKHMTEGFDLPWQQKSLNFVAAGIGFLNPYYYLPTVAGARFGGLAVRGITAAGEKLAPQTFSALARTSIRPAIEGAADEAIPQALEKIIPRTMGELGEHLTKSMSIGTAISVPEAFHDSYDRKTNSFDIAGGVKASLQGGLLAMAVDVVGVTGGVVYAKMKGASPKKALEDGQISQDEFEWTEAYNKEPENKEKLRDLGVKILLKDGYPIDSAQKKMILNLIKTEDHEKFQTGILDQLLDPQAGELNSALSDYMTRSNLDRLTIENGKFFDGLKGAEDLLNNSIEHSEIKLEALRKAIEKEKLSHITEEHPLAQKKVLASLKKTGYDLKQSVLSIPRNLRKRARQEKKIALLKNKDNSEGKIQEITDRLEPAHSVKEELGILEKEFLGDKPLHKNFRDSHEYHRIVDLAHSSEKARALLLHIDYKAELQNQVGYRSIISALNKNIESGTSRMADPDKVISYMKNRIAEKQPNKINPAEGNQPSGEIIKKDKSNGDKSIKESYKESIEYAMSNPGQFFQDVETNIDMIDNKELTEIAKLKKTRFFEFKDNDQVKNALISCIYGASKNG